MASICRLEHVRRGQAGGLGLRICHAECHPELPPGPGSLGLAVAGWAGKGMAREGHRPDTWGQGHVLMASHSSPPGPQALPNLTPQTKTSKCCESRSCTVLTRPGTCSRRSGTQHWPPPGPHRACWPCGEAARDAQLLPPSLFSLFPGRFRNQLCGFVPAHRLLLHQQVKARPSAPGDPLGVWCPRPAVSGVRPGGAGGREAGRPLRREETLWAAAFSDDPSSCSQAGNAHTGAHAHMCTHKTRTHARTHRKKLVMQACNI